MGKILIIVSIVVSAATAGLGFLNKGKLSAATEKVSVAESAATAAKADLTKTQATLKTTSENLATITAEKDQLASQVSSAKADLDKATAQATQAVADKTTAETKVTELTTELETAKKSLADAQNSTATPTVDPATEEMKSRLAEQETVITKLQQDLDSTRGKNEEYVKAQQDRLQQKMRNGLEGRILAVNPAWNFVVLNLGDKNGVVNNAEMLIKRGTQLIGKVRITSVEPSTSIADIVANSVPQGTSISPGDNVIYQAIEE